MFKALNEKELEQIVGGMYEGKSLSEICKIVEKKDMNVARRKLQFPREVKIPEGITEDFIYFGESDPDARPSGFWYKLGSKQIISKMSPVEMARALNAQKNI